MISAEGKIQEPFHSALHAKSGGGMTLCMFSHTREDRIILHLEKAKTFRAVLRNKLFQLREGKKKKSQTRKTPQAAIILSAQDLFNNPVSANHKLKIFPVTQHARPQLHKTEKTCYKWPETLKNCGNIASGCKALSCGKNILQLSVPCWQLALTHSGFHQKGCSKLWIASRENFLAHYSDLFISPPFLLHHTSDTEENENSKAWKKMNVQEEDATCHRGIITGFST